jgi:hypothetical protein
MSRNTPADDLSRSLTAFEEDTTLVVVVEMSWTGWLVAGCQSARKVDPPSACNFEPRGLV